MIKRTAFQEIRTLLQEFPAVAILGPRQVGKTTLAQEIVASLEHAPVFLDLELPSDLAKLADAENYFEAHQDRLVVLDEIQRFPEIFTVLRAVIDRRKRQGQKTGQFLILGSASLDLLKQSSESLAGRIAFKTLTGLTVPETADGKHGTMDTLWLRGGFPDSFLSSSDEASFRWRLNFISTYLERDVPQFGPRIPAVTLKRLWTMLAHSQGGQLNMSKLASGLDVASPTVKRYIELLEDLLLIRSLQPWSANIGKRLVKTPKVYIRDSGITHALLNLTSLDDVLGHPVAGPSWEAFVVENLMSSLPPGITPWFYRTAAGAEIDLVIEKNAKTRFAVEIKRSLAPTVSKGFHLGCDDIKASEKFVVYSGNELYTMPGNIQVIPVSEMMRRLREL